MQNEKLYRLFRLQCQDLLVLGDMEYNGMVYDVPNALAEAQRLQKDSDTLLCRFHRLVSHSFVNITSGDHISAVLYGGIIEDVVRVAIGHFRTGARQGQVKYTMETFPHQFPALVNPIPRTETAKNKSGK